MERLLVTPQEAAEMLGLGRSKTYQLLASGELPAVRIGRAVRIPVEGLTAWLRQRSSVGRTVTDPGRET